MLVGEQSQSGFSVDYLNRGGTATLVAEHELLDHPDLAELDAQLDAELTAANANADCAFSERVGAFYLNSEIAEKVRPEYKLGQLQQLEAMLRKKGTLTVPITYGTLELDGVPHQIPLIAATETDAHHGEMSSMLYLRDHIQTASAFLEMADADPKRYTYEGQMGKELMLSALHLLSTPSQLERQKFVIEHGQEAGQLEWPHISLMFDDLEGTQTVNWRHKQDTIYMMQHLALDALSRGIISPDDLTTAHKKFMGNMLPFIMATGYPANESNSGSWEEYAAMGRTSVVAIQAAMLEKQYKLLQRTDRDQFDFLRSGLREQLGTENDGDIYGSTLVKLVYDGLRHVGRQLPNETPDEPTGTVRYREADMALVYVLRYGLPKLLAEHNIPIGAEQRLRSKRQIEDMVLGQLKTLMDPTTGGMRRYAGDSYQRNGWFTRATQKKIKKIKQDVQAATKQNEQTKEPILRQKLANDILVEKQRLRDEHVPKGREAMWNLGVNEIAAWGAHEFVQATRQGNQADQRHYQRIATKIHNQGLRTVTGKDQYHLELDEHGDPVVKKTKEARYAEALITHNDKIIASPHNPLNWSVAISNETFALLGAGLRLGRSRNIGRLSIGNRPLGGMRTSLSRIARHAFAAIS